MCQVSVLGFGSKLPIGNYEENFSAANVFWLDLRFEQTLYQKYRQNENQKHIPYFQ